MKKLLAITLTLVMLLGTIGISVSADMKIMTKSEIEEYFNFHCSRVIGTIISDTVPFYSYIRTGYNTIELIEYWGGDDNWPEIEIPETVDGATVLSINPRFGDTDTYLGARGVTYAVFPKTITKLGLNSCDIKELVVPETVTELGFYYCDTERVTLFDSVKTLYLVGNKYIELLVYKTGTNELSQLSKDTVIYGVSGSYAEKYANEYGCIFVDIQKKLGDINNDTAINGKDVLDLRKYLIGLTDTINTDNADVNGDGKINGKDVLHLRKYLVGLVTWLGVNETPSDIVVETPDNL